MIELFSKGGPIMWLLLLTSVAGLTIVLQKVWVLVNTRIKRETVDNFKQNVSMSGVQAALKELYLERGYTAQVIQSGVRISELKTPNLRGVVADMLDQEQPKFEKNLSILSALTTIAPLLGLLGTILGLLDIFNVISGGGIGDTAQLSGGIAEALLTTMTGLSIAIPFTLIQQYIYEKIDQRLQDIESILRYVVNIKRDRDIAEQKERGASAAA